MSAVLDSTIVSLDRYQEFTRATDHGPKKGYEGLRFPLLGLFGEVGSLLSELKKKQRDTESYVGYAASVVEEFGDVMWYFTNVADRANIKLQSLAQRMFLDLDNWDVSSRTVESFDDIQIRREHVGPVSSEKFETGAIALAGRVGRLLDEVSLARIEANRDALQAHLIDIFRAIVQAADDADISLQDAVEHNIAKITSRWRVDGSQYTELFDNDSDGDEQLPRRIVMLIEEKKVGQKEFVVQKCNDIKIGDHLTDNIAEQDDYRFHDAFHLSYAAILGWSPVLRSLFKVKRKSKPAIDENEDGARAGLIEEGVATWIFNHAVRVNYFATIDHLDYALLKAVKELVKGYEVDRCPLWMWEEAILEGYKVFRFLRDHRKGLVTADLKERTITIEPV